MKSTVFGIVALSIILLGTPISAAAAPNRDHLPVGPGPITVSSR